MPPKSTSVSLRVFSSNCAKLRLSKKVFLLRNGEYEVGTGSGGAALRLRRECGPLPQPAGPHGVRRLLPAVRHVATPAGRPRPLA
jgi:hypothetical protein